MRLIVDGSLFVSAAFVLAAFMPAAPLQAQETAAPQSSPHPFEQSPSPPQVHYLAGQLEVTASNSTFADVMTAIQNATGATFEGTTPTSTERIFGRFGPAAPNVVLSAVLSGSQYDFVIVGSESQDSPIQRVILSTRGLGARGKVSVQPIQAPLRQSDLSLARHAPGNPTGIVAGHPVHETNDANFEQDVLNARQPVMVDFWASWCGPCRALAPIVDEIASEYDGRLIVFKIDMDLNKEIPARYGVHAIPTLLVFENGQVQEQLVGYAGKGKIEQALNKHITAQNGP